jgi:Undecaprenyl-phosphate glucose phosphotransferase
MRKVQPRRGSALAGSASALAAAAQKPASRVIATGPLHTANASLRPADVTHAAGALNSPASVAAGALRHTAFRLGRVESPSVILLREVLGPAVTVATLAVCMWGDGAPLSIDSLALGVIVFLLSQKVLSTPECRTLPDGRRELHPGFGKLLLEWSCVFALLLFILLALRLTGLVGPTGLAAWYLITPPALLLSNAAATRMTRWWTTRRPASARHIIIGATEPGLELAKRIQQSSSSSRFLGYFDFRDRGRVPLVSADHWIGKCSEVADFVRREAVDAIYIALPISTTPRIAELIRQLRDTTASIYLIPANIFEFDLVQPRCVEIQGIPALAICETPYQGLSALRKRILDVTLAVTALLLAGPAMVAIAIAIKLNSRGPVFFRQRRYGLHGEEMFVYKFRSMTVCEDGPQVTQAKRNDIRTTRVGRFLRRTSLDELPQILNVLQGKMSFVGPRPHAIAHNEMYRKLISGYMTRHKVRPGITGWAQVNGLRGETDTLDKMRRRIEYDLQYLNNWSMWLDLKILLKTVVLVLRDDHAY